MDRLDLTNVRQHGAVKRHNGRRPSGRTREQIVERDGKPFAVHTLDATELERWSLQGRAFWIGETARATYRTMDGRQLVGTESASEQEESLLSLNDLLEVNEEETFLGFASSLGVDNWERLENALWLLDDNGPTDAWERQDGNASRLPNNLSMIGYNKKPTPQWEPAYYASEDGQEEARQAILDCIAYDAKLTGENDLFSQYELDKMKKTVSFAWRQLSGNQTLKDEERKVTILRLTGGAIELNEKGVLRIVVEKGKDFDPTPLVQQSDSYLALMDSLEGLTEEDDEEESNDLSLAMANVPGQY